MPHCVAYGCNLQSKLNNKGDVSVHIFPKERALRKQWQDASGRLWLPKDPRLCSRHFSPDAFESYHRPKLMRELAGVSGHRRRLKPDALPTKLSPWEVKRQQLTMVNRSKRREKQDAYLDHPSSSVAAATNNDKYQSSNLTSMVSDLLEATAVDDSTSNPADADTEVKANNQMDITQILPQPSRNSVCVQAAVVTKPSSTQTSVHKPHETSAMCLNQEKVQAVSKMAKGAVAADIPQKLEKGIIPRAGCKILPEESTESECQAPSNETMLVKDKLNGIGLNENSLKNDDKKVNILTGLPTVTLLMTLFNFVAPFLEPKSNMTSFQQYMLTSIKLRMNLSFDFLAYYFSVESATVLKLFKHCINVLYRRLVPCLVVWPDRESLKNSLPCEFRSRSFENTVCIIGCFEILIEKPNNLLAGAHCYASSQHKMKYLIAVCPQGSICFISNGWGSCTSDKFIADQSQFLHNLQRGDLVLANQSFNRKRSERSYGMKLPAFTRGKNQLDPVVVANIGCLASLRVNIEGVIGLLCQKYPILQSTVPVGLTDIGNGHDVTCLDKIVHVCCALTNVS
ncbi:uncharacterized protein LOC144033872 [Vanacampus margaritifer]